MVPTRVIAFLLARGDQNWPGQSVSAINHLGLYRTDRYPRYQRMRASQTVRRRSGSMQQEAPHAPQWAALQVDTARYFKIEDPHQLLRRRLILRPLACYHPILVCGSMMEARYGTHQESAALPTLLGLQQLRTYKHNFCLNDRFVQALGGTVYQEAPAADCQCLYWINILPKHSPGHRV